MTLETRDKIFPYLTTDYKAADAWLNTQAQEGWRVESFFFRQWGVTLVPDDRPGLRYCVDLYGGKKDTYYLEQCHQAGWELVETVRSMNIFCSIPGRNPAPIQTDPDSERDRFERKHVYTELLSGLFSFLLLLLLVLIMFPFAKMPGDWTAIPIRILSSWSDSLFFLSLLFFVLLGLWQTVSMLRYFCHCRTAVAEGSPIPVPKDRQARRRGKAQFLAVLLYLLILLLRFFSTFNTHSYHDENRAQLRSQPVIMAEDIHDAPEANWCTFDRTGTPLVQHIEYEDFTAIGPSNDSYRCCSELLAQWAVRDLYNDYIEDFPLEPVELGFDESWHHDSGNGYQMLLLRQGRVAVLLSGSVDWTDPDLQPVLWERLALE